MTEICPNLQVKTVSLWDEEDSALLNHEGSSRILCAMEVHWPHFLQPQGTSFFAVFITLQGSACNLAISTGCDPLFVKNHVLIPKKSYGWLFKGLGPC